MHVSVNGVRLFFDIEGAKFVPDRLLRSADIAQIVYLDHRQRPQRGQLKIKPAPEGAGWNSE